MDSSSSGREVGSEDGGGGSSLPPSSSDTSSGGAKEYYCNACELQLNGPVCYKQHLIGARHIKKTEKLGLLVPNGSSECGSNGLENAASSAPQPAAPRLLNRLSSVSEPIVGLDSITEKVGPRPSSSPGYTCDLCGFEGDSTDVVNHITGAKHRFAYIKSTRATLIPDLMDSNGEMTRDMKRGVVRQRLIEVSERLESELGRGRPRVQMVTLEEEQQEKSPVRGTLTGISRFDPDPPPRPQEPHVAPPPPIRTLPAPRPEADRRDGGPFPPPSRAPARAGPRDQWFDPRGEYEAKLRDHYDRYAGGMPPPQPRRFDGGPREVYDAPPMTFPPRIMHEQWRPPPQQPPPLPPVNPPFDPRPRGGFPVDLGYPSPLPPPRHPTDHSRTLDMYRPQEDRRMPAPVDHRPPFAPDRIREEQRRAKRPRADRSPDDATLDDYDAILEQYRKEKDQEWMQRKQTGGGGQAELADSPPPSKEIFFQKYVREMHVEWEKWFEDKKAKEAAAKGKEEDEPPHRPKQARETPINLKECKQIVAQCRIKDDGDAETAIEISRALAEAHVQYKLRYMKAEEKTSEVQERYKTVLGFLREMQAGKVPTVRLPDPGQPIRMDFSAPPAGGNMAQPPPPPFDPSNPMFHMMMQAAAAAAAASSGQQAPPPHMFYPQQAPPVSGGAAMPNASQMAPPQSSQPGAYPNPYPQYTGRMPPAQPANLYLGFPQQQQSPPTTAVAAVPQATSFYPGPSPVGAK